MLLARKTESAILRKTLRQAMFNGKQPPREHSPRHGLRRRIFLAFLFILTLLLLLPGKCERKDWPAFVRLIQAETRQIIPQGEPYSLVIKLSPDSLYAPSHASFQQGDRMEKHAPLNKENRSYTIPLDPTNRKELLRVQAGNAVSNMKLIPRNRPIKQSAQAEITFPEYMGSPVSIIDMNEDKLSVPEGASLRLRIASSSDLSSASALIDGKPTRPSIKGNEISLPLIPLVSKPINIELNWKSSDGLTNAFPIPLTISPRKDQPPSTRISRRNNTLLVLEDASIELNLETHDDYGVAELGVEWTLKTPPSQKKKKELTSFRKIITQGNRAKKDIQSSFVFTPQLLGITPQEVVIKSFSNDFFPGRTETKSRALIIRIMSKEEHTQTLRSLVDRLVGEIHDLSGKLKDTEEEARVLSLQTSDSLKSETCTGKISNLADSINKYSSKVNALSSFAQRLFLEGARNEEIDPDGMKQLLSATRWLDEETAHTILQVEQYFATAANEPEGTQRRSALMKGISSLAQIDTALKTAMEQFDKSARSIASGSLLKRLEKTYRKQNELTSLLAAEKKKKAPSPPNNEKDELQTLSVLQQSILNEISWMKDDLELLKARKKSPSYAQLHGLLAHTRLQDMIQQNIGNIRSALLEKAIIQSNSISQTLAELSQSIHEKRNRTGKKSPLPPAIEKESDLSDSSFERTLRLIRMIQKQDQIRLQTEEALRRLPFGEPIKNAFSLLAEKQDELQADMLDLILMSGQGNHHIIRMMNECRKIMNHSVTLLETEQAKQETINTQKSILSLLGRTAEQSTSPPSSHIRPGNNTTSMLNILRQIPSLRSPQGENTPLSVPPADCSRDDIPLEFRKAFDAYRKTLQH